MSENDNVENAVAEFKKSLAKKYTKEELVDRLLNQFESTKIAMSVLTVLTSDESSGSDRALARIQGREIVKIYNELMDE